MSPNATTEYYIICLLELSVLLTQLLVLLYIRVISRNISS